MIKYFSKAFNITNENIILTTPLVLFLMLFSVYLELSRNAVSAIQAFILLIVTSLLMLSAFLAGWFFMVKRAVDLDKVDFIIDEDKARASFGLMKEIPIGIGNYFLSFVAGLILYAGLIVLFSIVAYTLGEHFIGKIDLNTIGLKMASLTPETMKKFVESLSMDQRILLAKWNFLIVSIITVFSFITMFWPAHVIIKNKNAFVAFFQALKYTFKNFLPSVILFVYISFVEFAVQLFNAVSVVNPILYFIAMLVYFYFVVYIVVLVFLYYDSEANPKFEYRIDDSYLAKSSEASDNSGGRPYGGGQEQSGDSDSKEK